MTRKYSVVDLFAGAGGLSLGFEQTKMFDIKYAVEVNYYARQTYRKNNKHIKLFENIYDVKFRELIKEYGEIDIVIGGPPCQGFSNANRQKNDLISGNNNLVNEFIRAIEELDPKAFVMENVKTISSSSHKFFLTRGKEKELEQLEVTLHENEEILVGKIEGFSETLSELARNQEIDLLPFFLNKDVFSKLYSLYRCRKNPAKLNKYLIKNQEFFRQLNGDCTQHHPMQLSNEYAELWNLMSLYLEESIHLGSVHEDLLQTIDSILEIQRLLIKVDEVRLNDIPYVVEERNAEVILKVTTYNVFEYVEKKLESLGYNVRPDVLKALQFGVPQHRERMFVVGIKNEYIQTAERFLPRGFLTRDSQYYTIQDAIQDLENIEPTIDVHANPIEKSRTLVATASNNPLRSYLTSNVENIKNHVITATTDVAMKRFVALGQGQSFQDLNDDQKSTYSDPSRTQKTVYHRLEYNKPSRTVVNVRKSMWIHPTKNRAISIREAARLQSFPDTYEFMGTKDAQYQQIGNAVPPLLGRAVAEQLLAVLGSEVKRPLRQELYRSPSGEQVQDTALCHS